MQESFKCVHARNPEDFRQKHSLKRHHAETVKLKFLCIRHNGMSFIDRLPGKEVQLSPNEELLGGLSALDPALSSSFRTYLQNKSRLGVLSREAVEQYQMVKSKDKNEQTRAMEQFFREAHTLIEQQRRLLVTMQDVSKKRRFKMAKDLADVVSNVKKTEDTLRRIVGANNDHAINRLQGMNDTLAMHRSMESSVLLPALR